jgi:hypothetical protein
VDQLALAAHKDFMVLQDLQVHRAMMVLQVPLVLQGHKDHKVMQDLADLAELKVYMVPAVPAVLLGEMAV